MPLLVDQLEYSPPSCDLCELSDPRGLWGMGCEPGRSAHQHLQHLIESENPRPQGIMFQDTTGYFMRFHGKIWQWHLKLSTMMCTAWFEVRLKDGRICKDELERVLARYSNHDVKTHVIKRCKKTRSSLKNLMGELFFMIRLRSWQDLTRSDQLPGDVEPGLHQEGLD